MCQLVLKITAHAINKTIFNMGQEQNILYPKNMNIFQLLLLANKTNY